jgi:general secretion pathway protein J
MTRPRPTIRSGGAGFTLIEILVALLILSIMSALGYQTYRAARISAGRTEDSMKRTREIEFGMRTFAQDIAESVPRPVRDMLGQSRLPAMHGTRGAGTLTLPTGTSELGATSASPGMTFDSGPGFGATTDASVIPMLELTRAGWSNTAGQQRGTLQRVSYALVGDVLKRSYQTSLDTVISNKPVVQDLLTGVTAVQLRYLDANQAWQDQWPLPASAPDPNQSRPIAVEVIVQFKDWGIVRRLIEVAG